MLTARRGWRSNIAVSTALSSDEDQRDDRKRQLNTSTVLLRTAPEPHACWTCKGAWRYRIDALACEIQVSPNKRVLVAYWLLECLLVFMLRGLRVPT